MIVILNQEKVEGDEVRGIGRGQIIKVMIRSLGFMITKMRYHCGV